MAEIEPPDTYRPQFRLRWRGLVRLLDRFPRLKSRLADTARGILRKVFDPEMVSTERIIEYPFVFQHLPEVAGPVLDLGCCSSQVSLALASRGFPVIGVDFNPYPYRHPNFHAVRGDAMQLPFRPGTFAAVLAISMIEHVGIGHYGDPLAQSGDQAVIYEIARTLKPRGKALITVPFGRARTDDFQRIYDPTRLSAVLTPLRVAHLEHACSSTGLWTPCTEAEAASADWSGSTRAVALVVATTASR
jgi:SAM-dependent methyltransferase